MSIWGRLSFVAAVVASASAAHAEDPRCAHPPYGGSPDRYRAVLEVYGRDIATVDKLLEEICKMKFDGADRSALYKLQFKDADIDSMGTAALALEMRKRVEVQSTTK